MTRINTMARLVAVAGAAVLVLAACGDGDTDEGATPDGATPTAAASPTGEAMSPDGDMDHSEPPTASFVAPEDGATATSPVAVEMAAEGIEIAPAADAVEGAGHFHVMVDTDCLAVGETIPNDDTHLHFGDGSTSADVELEPGEHTLCLQVGTNDHSATAATAEITVTVE